MADMTQPPIPTELLLQLQTEVVAQIRVQLAAVGADMTKTWSLVVIVHPNDTGSIKLIG